MLCSFLKVIFLLDWLWLTTELQPLNNCVIVWNRFWTEQRLKVWTVESNRQGCSSFLLTPPPNVDLYFRSCNSVETLVSTQICFGHQISPQEHRSSVSDWKSDHQVVIVDIFHICPYCLWKWKHRGYVFWLPSLRTIVLGHYLKPQHKRGTGQTSG